MNRAFDYNGKVVSQSTPVPKLRTVKKVVHIDSADRDTTKYFTNGDFVVYLPRTYENVVSIRLMAGEFPPLVITSSSAGAITHPYDKSTNLKTGFSNASDTVISAAMTHYYFLIDLEGLDKSDECAIGASKSTYTDGFFAKIPALTNSYGGVPFIEYNDHSGQDNIAKYTPAIGKLDRLRIRTRLHSQQGNSGFIYWTTNGAAAASDASNLGAANFSLSLEIEYLDNVFDEFSSFESRISDRS